MKKAILPIEYNEEDLNKTDSSEEYLPSSSPGHQIPTGAYGTNIVLVG